MSSQAYVDGVLETIPNPLEKIDLTWGKTGEPWVSNGEDYVWMASLPGGYSQGFRMIVYRAASSLAPYPIMGCVSFDPEDSGDEIYFASHGELIRYVKEHAELMQVTVLAIIADRIDAAFEWIFDDDHGIFASHVAEQCRRARRGREQRATKARPPA